METPTAVTTNATAGLAVAPTRGRSWRTGARVASTVLAVAVVVLLRQAGALDGPFALTLVGLCFVFGPGPRPVADRFLLVAAVCIGWLPLLGWIPSLGLRIDVPGVLLAVAVGLTVGWQLHERRTGPRTVQRPTLAEAIALGLGAITGLWWARPFLSMTTSGILGALQRAGYDNVSHFGMYQSNLKLGSFIQARPRLPDGAARFGYDYPQGLHQAWAQFTRLIRPHTSLATSSLLHSYVVVLLVTAGGAVALGCMAVVRLCRSDVLVAVPAMAVILALFAVGTFTPLDGYANYELAIVSVATAVTLIVRPTLSPTWNFVAVAGLGLVAAYNWYPLLVLVAPALLVATLRVWSANHGRARIAVGVVLFGTSVAYLLPFTAFSHRGLSWLNEPTSSLATPWGVLLMVVAALLTIACLRQVADPDLATNAVIGGTAVLGMTAVAFVAAYEVHSTGNVPYYGQKLASAVLAVCAVVLVAVIAQQIVASRIRQRLPTLLAIALAGILTVAAVQFDGYAGPTVVSPFTYNNALGIEIRDALFLQPKSSAGAMQLLLAARAASGRPGSWVYLDPSSPSGWYLTASWFWVLRGDPPNREFDLGIPLQFTGDPSASYDAREIIKQYAKPGSDVRLFVPVWLLRAIVRQAPTWGKSGEVVAIPGSGGDPAP